jgi:hypothetical protein
MKISSGYFFKILQLIFFHREGFVESRIRNFVSSLELVEGVLLARPYAEPTAHETAKFNKVSVFWIGLNLDRVLARRGMRHVCFFFFEIRGEAGERLEGGRLEGGWREAGGGWREAGGRLEGGWREAGGRLEGDRRRWETGGRREAGGRLTSFFRST